MKCAPLTVVSGNTFCTALTAASSKSISTNRTLPISPKRLNSISADLSAVIISLYVSVFLLGRMHGIQQWQSLTSQITVDGIQLIRAIWGYVEHAVTYKIFTLVDGGQLSLRTKYEKSPSMASVQKKQFVLVDVTFQSLSSAKSYS